MVFYAYAMVLSRNPALAADLVQDTSRPQGQGKSSAQQQPNTAECSTALQRNKGRQNVFLPASGLMLALSRIHRNGDFMKKAGKLSYVLINFTMFFATTAFAADKGSLHIHSPTMAGETQLPVGEYTVQWEGAGPDVELKIKLDKRVKATVPAKVVPLDEPLREDETVLGTDSKRGWRLIEIGFSGK
jgi:hypothetical protein